jgi:hypothetical protein
MGSTSIAVAILHVILDVTSIYELPDRYQHHF